MLAVGNRLAVAPVQHCSGGERNNAHATRDFTHKNPEQHEGVLLPLPLSSSAPPPRSLPLTRLHPQDHLRRGPPFGLRASLLLLFSLLLLPRLRPVLPVFLLLLFVLDLLVLLLDLRFPGVVVGDGGGGGEGGGEGGGPFRGRRVRAAAGLRRLDPLLALRAGAEIWRGVLL